MEPIRYDSLQEPLDDEERELMDPENWDWENPVEIHTVGTPGAVLRLHFSREEYIALSRHARAQGLATHEFIRQLALAAVSTPAR